MTITVGVIVSRLAVTYRNQQPRISGGDVGFADRPHGNGNQQTRISSGDVGFADRRSGNTNQQTRISSGDVGFADHAYDGRRSMAAEPDPCRRPKMRGCRKWERPRTFSQLACLKMRGCRTRIFPSCSKMRGCRKDYVSKCGDVEKSGAYRFRHPRIFVHGKAISLQGRPGFRQPRILGQADSDPCWVGAGSCVAQEEASMPRLVGSAPRPG